VWVTLAEWSIGFSNWLITVRINTLVTRFQYYVRLNISISFMCKI